MCLVPADPCPSMTATPFSRVYGVSLGTHLQEHGRDIALPIEACVLMLSHGMKEEVASTPAPTLRAVPATGGALKGQNPGLDLHTSWSPQRCLWG